MSERHDSIDPMLLKAVERLEQKMDQILVAQGEMGIGFAVLKNKVDLQQLEIQALTMQVKDLEEASERADAVAKYRAWLVGTAIGLGGLAMTLIGLLLKAGAA